MSGFGSGHVVVDGGGDLLDAALAALPIAAGTNFIVYAVGSLEGETLTVLTETITGLGDAPAAVNTGNSPVDDNVAVFAFGAVALAAAVAFETRRVRSEQR